MIFFCCCCLASISFYPYPCFVFLCSGSIVSLAHGGFSLTSANKGATPLPLIPPQISAHRSLRALPFTVTSLSRFLSPPLSAFFDWTSHMGQSCLPVHHSTSPPPPCLEVQVSSRRVSCRIQTEPRLTADEPQSPHKRHVHSLRTAVGHAVYLGQKTDYLSST